ncbi:MAG: GTPase [Planctomycetota bacterium]
MAVPFGAPRRASLELGERVVDDVLVVDRGPMGLELHLHGSPVVLRLLSENLSESTVPGGSAADDLLHRATCREQLELALEQRAVPFADYLTGLAAIDPLLRQRELGATVERSRVAAAHVVPFRIALIGCQNAGKSTLFNRLLFRERALAGPVAGLTRDPIRETTTLGGYPYEILDTAGEAEGLSGVDEVAVQLARESRQQCDLAMLVIDGSIGPTQIDRALHDPHVLVVATKCDLSVAAWPEDLPCHLRVSCADASSAAAVREAIARVLRHRRSLPPAGPVGGPAALSADEREALMHLAFAAGLRPA